MTAGRRDIRSDFNLTTVPGLASLTLSLCLAYIPTQRVAFLIFLKSKIHCYVQKLVQIHWDNNPVRDTVVYNRRLKKKGHILKKFGVLKKTNRTEKTSNFTRSRSNSKSNRYPNTVGDICNQQSFFGVPHRNPES
jgi:16S rRNA C1402 (ribose-2'-O) methylase RsmI